MAITFPLSLEQFADKLPITEVKWHLQEQQEYSGLGSGEILAADLGPSLWKGDVRLAPGYHNDVAAIQAMIETLDGSMNPFYLYDPRRVWPIAYPRGSWPGNVVGDVTAQGDFLTAPASAYSVSRASTATYFDSTGTMQTAGANEARFDHDPSNINVLWPSEDFSHKRWVSSEATITNNYATIGGRSFCRFTPTTGTTATRRLYQYADFQSVGGSAQTMMFRVKSDGQTTTRIALRVDDSTGILCYYGFDIANGTKIGVYSGGYPGQIIDSTIEDVGNGVFEVSVSYRYRDDSTPIRPIFHIYAMHPTNNTSVYNFNGVDGYLISSCQCNTYTDTKKPYVKTTTGIAAQYRGLLLEEERRNYIPQSNNLANPAHTATGVIRTANAAVAPNGATEAALLVETDDNASHTIVSTAAPTGATAGTELWSSICVKMASPGRRYISVETANFANQLERTIAYVDLVTGEFYRAHGGVVPAAKVESHGGGWWRVSLRHVYAGTGSTGFRVYMRESAESNSSTYIGDGVSGIYAWGVQMEGGSGPSALIPTGAAAVTRNADIITVNNAGGNDWTLTHDDGSAQAYSGIQGNLSVWRPDLSRPWLRSFDARLVNPLTSLTGVNVYSINDNRKAIRLSGLPAGYRLSVGDYLSFDYGTNPVRRALHRIAETVTAGPGGITDEFEIRPHLRTGAAAGVEVSLTKPAAKVIMVPNTFDPGTGSALHTDGMSFQVVQTLR